MIFTFYICFFKVQFSLLFSLILQVLGFYSTFLTPSLSSKYNGWRWRSYDPYLYQYIIIIKYYNHHSIRIVDVNYLYVLWVFSDNIILTFSEHYNSKYYPPTKNISLYDPVWPPPAQGLHRRASFREELNCFFKQPSIDNK